MNCIVSFIPNNLIISDSGGETTCWQICQISKGYRLYNFPPSYYKGDRSDEAFMDYSTLPEALLEAKVLVDKYDIRS